MGGLVAVLDKTGDNASETALRALATLGHRGDDAFGVSTGTQVFFSDSLTALAESEVEARVASAYRLQMILSSDTAQPVGTSWGDLVFEGEAYAEQALITGDNVAGFLEGEDGATALSHFVERYDGMYAGVLNDGSRLRVMKDPQGLKPLYVGENSRYCAFASERKALWRIGIGDGESLPPGVVVETSPVTTTLKMVRGIDFSRPGSESVGVTHAAERVSELLSKAVRERARDVDEVAVAFSGGIDSSIAAFVAKRLGLGVRLFTVRIGGYPSPSDALKAADALDLPVTEVSKSLEDVEADLERVLWLVEEPDLMKLQIALPLYWTGAQAAHSGFKVLLLGQGADELFGGYKRFQEVYAARGRAEAQKAISDSVRCSPTVNYERDEPVLSACKIRPRLPYTDLELTEYALRLPLELKLASPSDRLRKRILREVAGQLHLASFIVESRKRAIQYETGTQKALAHIARKRHLKPRQLVEHLFHRMKMLT